MSEGNAAGEPSAAGGPRPLLSGARGLIGRRPAPPLTPGRLPSIRSRDLTLGGVKKVPDGTFLQKPNYAEFQAPGGLTVGPTVRQAWCWALRIWSSDFRLQFLGSLPCLQVKILGLRC